MIGGLVTLGLIGVFLGPVILAVSHTLPGAWIDQSAEQAETGARNSSISSVPDLVVVAGFGSSSNEPKEDKR